MAEPRERILLAGTGRFFRNLDTILVVAAGNAVVSAFIVSAVPVETSGLLVNLGATVLSFAAWLVLAGLVCSIGLDPSGRHIGAQRVVTKAQIPMMRVVVWGGFVLIVLAAAAWVFTWLVPVVALLYSAVPAAAAAGESNPIVASLRTVLRHPGRVLLLAALVVFVATLLGVFMGLWSLLLPTPLAQFLVLWVEGLIVSWALLCMARVYAATAPQPDEGRGAAPVAAEGESLEPVPEA